MSKKNCMYAYMRWFGRVRQNDCVAADTAACWEEGEENAWCWMYEAKEASQLRYCKRITAAAVLQVLHYSWHSSAIIQNRVIDNMQRMPRI